MPPASLPAERPDVVVVALSARALAAAARRAGRRPAAIDLFGDEDTKHLADPCVRLPSAGLRLDAGALLDALARPELRDVPLVYGAGFEDDPPLLARIAEDRPVFGNPAEVVARAKDPFAFAGLLDRLGIPHPPVARALAGVSPDTLADGYLLKRIGGSGGGHVAVASIRQAPPGWYFQRRVRGESVSVLFLGDGRRSAVIGISRQWTSPASSTPYRYGGVAAPLRLPKPLGASLRDMVARLTEALGLVGLNSADFLVAGPTVHLLEVNPRPGASLDVFDRAPMPPLFGLHLDACAGGLPKRLPTFWGCRAAVVHYAAAPILIGAHVRWPAWTADRPATPASIDEGQPIVTVLADGAGVASARRMAERRREQLAAGLSRRGTPARRQAAVMMEMPP
ncbi:MAG TPA: ATP-grasp domain-containing protein [Azospirillum sp.]|nr:ATP-grasp domain-containing protein [Azospirillum sp.]